MPDNSNSNNEEAVQLPDPDKLVVSTSPHMHDNQQIRKIMLTVLLALAPACIAGFVFFGARVLWVIALCCGSCVAFEALFAKMLGKPIQIRDLSALVTGLILALNLAVIAPWWLCVVGALLSVGLGKMIFGGLGYNPFNPAIVGRVGLLVAFPKVMTEWVSPKAGSLFYNYDAATTATPLGKTQLGELATNQIGAQQYWDYFLGNMGGCIGETSALALLIGGVALIAFRIIRWEIPVFYIGTVALIAGTAHAIAPETYAPALFHVLTGGLMLGAFFIATDYVSSPMGSLGAIIFAVGCGIITCVIRLLGNYPEGVSFAILFMNAFVPLIDRATAPKPFGFQKQEVNA